MPECVERQRGEPVPQRKSLDPDSPSVHTHLTIEQGIIARMAENSRHCKFWCVTITSAILFFSARGNSPLLILTALIPLCLLGGLDAYYLAQERSFRAASQRFTKRLHRRRLRPSELYVWNTGSILRRWPGTFRSFSVGVFYLSLAATVGLVWLIQALSPP